MELTAEAMRAAFWRSGLADKVPDWEAMATPVMWAWWSECAPFIWDMLEHNREIGDRLRAAHPGDGLENEVTAYASERARELTDAQVCAVIGELDAFGSQVQGLDRLSTPQSAREYLNVIAASALASLVFSLVTEHGDPNAGTRRERWKAFAAEHNARHGNPG